MRNGQSVFSVVTRRVFLVSGAAAVSALRALAAEPRCTLVSEQEEGPYYVEAAKLRQVITEDRPGVPLRLQVRVVNAKTCAPLPNAAFDIWHCDAQGVYSGFTAMGSGFAPGGPGRPGGPPPEGFGPPPNGFGPPPGPPPDGFGGPGRGRGPGARNIDKTRFLRGLQITDKDGMVAFRTLYPGWYEGRTIHIHMKVHLAGTAGETYQGGHVCHTGQIFLPEEVTERIAKLSPYAENSRVHRTTQAEDHVFQEQHGAEQIAGLERLMKHGRDSDGFLASIALAVDPDATPALVGPGEFGRG